MHSEHGCELLELDVLEQNSIDACVQEVLTRTGGVIDILHVAIFLLLKALNLPFLAEADTLQLYVLVICHHTIYTVSTMPAFWRADLLSMGNFPILK